MTDINPAYYQSVSDYLLALSFTIDGDRFIKGSITIPVSEIVGYTPATFHNKAKAKGWLDAPAADEEHPLYSWGDQFVLATDFANHSGVKTGYCRIVGEPVPITWKLDIFDPVPVDYHCYRPAGDSKLIVWDEKTNPSLLLKKCLQNLGIE